MRSHNVRLDDIAQQQLADYDRHRPGSAFAAGLALSIEEAYSVQSRVAELRKRRGERMIGYKVGCTSPTIRQQLGVDHPVCGSLFETECFSSAVALPADRFAGLAIEGELAVRLARDVDADLFSDAELTSAIAAVFPVIELHNLVFRRDRPAVDELIANNAIHAGFVHAETASEPFNAHPARLRIFMNETNVAEVSGPELTGTVVRSLSWLAGALNNRGEHLQAGQIVLCGSVADLFPVSGPCRIAVTTDRFGSVTCQIVESSEANTGIEAP